MKKFDILMSQLLTETNLTFDKITDHERICVVVDMHVEDWNEIMKLCEKHHVNPYVIKFTGPGGGNPLVALTGIKRDIVGYLEKEYFGTPDVSMVFDDIPAMKNFGVKTFEVSDGGEGQQGTRRGR